MRANPHIRICHGLVADHCLCMNLARTSNLISMSVMMIVSADGSNHALLDKVLTNQADIIRQVLGRPIQDSQHQPSHAVVVARSAESIGSQEASCSFEVILAQPTFTVDDYALSQVTTPNM